MNFTSVFNSTIANNTAFNNTNYGLGFSSSTNNSISSSTLISNAYGIYITGGENNTFSNNNLINNTAFGIFLQSSANNNTIFNNNVSANVSIATSATAAFYLGSSGNRLYNNSAEVISNGYFLNNSASYNNLTNNTAINNTFAGFNLTTASSNQFNNNFVRGAQSFGFSVGAISNNNNLSNNSVYNNSQGFYVFNNNNNSIVNNTVNNNSVLGLNFTQVFNSTIANNTARNETFGLSFATSANNTISRNLVTNTTQAIRLQVSENNTLSNNTLANNTQYGIYLFTSGNNTLANNTAINNSIYGFFIQLSYGINLSYNNATNNSNAQYTLLDSAANFTSSNYGATASANTIDLNISNSSLTGFTGTTFFNFTTEYVTMLIGQATNVTIQTMTNTTGLVNPDTSCTGGQCNLVTPSYGVANITTSTGGTVSALGFIANSSRVSSVSNTNIKIGSYSSATWSPLGLGTGDNENASYTFSPVTSLSAYFGVVYFQANPGTSSSSTQVGTSSSSSLSATTNIVCPSTLNVNTNTGNVLVNVLQVNSGFNQVGSKLSDSSGNVQFTLPNFGSYQLDMSKVGYNKPSPVSFSFSAANCPTFQNPVQNTTVVVNTTVTTGNTSGVQTNQSTNVTKPAVVTPPAPKEDLVQKQNAFELIQRVDIEISKAAKTGANVINAKTTLAQATAAFNKKDYNEALKLAQSALAMVKSTATKSVAQTTTKPVAKPVATTQPSALPLFAGLGLVGIVVVVIIVAVAAYFLFFRKGGEGGAAGKGKFKFKDNQN